MAKVQAYVSDEVAEKINAIVDKRKAEGAKEKDVSFSSISTMLLELGLRVYEAQMERKESGFNQMEYNKVLIENVMKTQLSIAKVLGISSLSPHVSSIEKFEYGTMVASIREAVDLEVGRFFPKHEDE
ncbi:MAG: conjugal transfer relaxosome DNA-binding protein TraM [Acinetobacter sp.]